jgi:hypothetical protein
MYENGVTEELFVKMTSRDRKFLITVKKFQWAFYSFIYKYMVQNLHANSR